MAAKPKSKFVKIPIDGWGKIEKHLRNTAGQTFVREVLDPVVKELQTIQK